MALMTYSGTSGLDAVVRSIASAKALPSLTVALVAANGETLAEAKTDVYGRVHFDPPLLEGEEGQRAAWLSAIPALVAKYPQLKALLYFDADTTQRGEERRWSLRWDSQDVKAFARLAGVPALNTRHRRLKPG